MLVHTTGKRTKQWLLSACLLAGGFIVPAAFARVTFNTIDPVGVVADKGPSDHFDRAACVQQGPAS